MQPRLDPLEFSTVCSDVWCGLCLRESVCALPKSLRSRVTHDTKLWKAMCSSPEAKRSESSCTILPSHCIPVGSGSVEWGGLACILSLCVCARVCVHSINTDSFQRWAELKGAHRSRGVLVKLKEDGLKGKIAPKKLTIVFTFRVIILLFTHKHRPSSTCRLRKLDSRVSACFRLRLERPLDCRQS